MMGGGAASAPQVLGGQSYVAQNLTQLRNASDKSVFMRHGDIKAEVAIDLKYIRDINNVLKFYTNEEHEEILFNINEDTLNKVCKFHNISTREAMLKLQTQTS